MNKCILISVTNADDEHYEVVVTKDTERPILFEAGDARQARFLAHDLLRMFREREPESPVICELKGSSRFTPPKAH